jgi:hypothetical protein
VAFPQESASLDIADDSQCGPSPIVAAALRVFEDFGYPVIPCDETKKPLLKDWTHYKPGSYDDVERSFSLASAKLVGVRTGAVSGFFAIDIDPAGGQWLTDNFSRLECKRIHTTRRAGGRHLLYKIPASIIIRNSASKLAPGIDTRGEGGQLIWWPEHGGTVLEDGLPSEPPGWLLRELQRLGIADGGITKPNGAKQHETIGGGNRNQTLTKLAGSMRRAGLCVAAVRSALIEENAERFKPPLPQNEIDALLGQVDKWQRGVVETAGTQRAPMDWAAMAGKTPPQREWVIPYWVPAGHLTLLSGRGGIGKSLLAQHIGTAVAAGKGYIEPSIVQKRVLMWACEDDENELWRRQLLISSHLQVPMTELTGRFVVHSYAGADVTLIAPVMGKLEQTVMLDELAAQVRLYEAEFVILDNIARLFGGNENDRHAVTLFCALVQGACAPAGVLLLGHPAKALGSEFSGSTAWEGAVRSRLYFSDRPPDEKLDDESAPPANERIRYLSRRKANYSDLDLREISLIDGVLMPIEPERKARHQVFDPESSFAIDTVIAAVRNLAHREIYGSEASGSNYLPALAKRYELLGGLTDRQFAGVMRKMIMAGSLVREPVGAYKNRTRKIGLVHKT